MKRSHIIMMCGVAGSGKTTYALQKEQEGYIRLSIDETIWKDFGKYGVDYPKELYSEYSKIVEEKLRNHLINYLNEGKDVVIDFSFWQKSKRVEYRGLIENLNGIVSLVYLKASKNILEKRLKERSKRFDANAAFTITDSILTMYLNGFEEPIDEGEAVIVQK